MGTRSFIIQQSTDGFEGVYCHWDGYPDHNGRILFDSYATPEALGELIGGGDLSVLAPEIDHCEFYHRDRNEPHDSVKRTRRNRLADLIAIAERSGCEYVYVFNGKEWHYASRGTQCFGLSDGSSFSKLRPLAGAFHSGS